MMAYEADVYRISDADRVTVLPDNLTVADYPRLGVRQLKFFMYYAPDDDPALNARKLGLVARIGAECAAEGVRFLMEPLVYHPHIAPGTAAYARSQTRPCAPRGGSFCRTAVSDRGAEGRGACRSWLCRGLRRRRCCHAPRRWRRFAPPPHRRAGCRLSISAPGCRSTGSRHRWRWRSAGWRGISAASCAAGRSGRMRSEFSARRGEVAMRDWLADVGMTRLERLIAGCRTRDKGAEHAARTGLPSSPAAQAAMAALSPWLSRAMAPA